MQVKVETSSTPNVVFGKPHYLKFEHVEMEIVKKIREFVGIPAISGVKVSREDLHLPENFRVHIDVGGEGKNEHMGCISGFTTSINLNAMTHQSNDYGIAIPNLVEIEGWYGKYSYPFADGFADCITMQNAPLTQRNVEEIARCLRPGGTVELWIAPEFKQEMEQLAQLLNSEVEYDVADEFQGSTGSVKFRIVSNLKLTLEKSSKPTTNATPQVDNSAAVLVLNSFFSRLNQKAITYPGYEPAFKYK